MNPPLLGAEAARIEAAELRLAAVLQGLEREHYDWSPDLGIPSVRDHLWAIAEAERGLLARLSGREHAEVGLGAREIPLTEILKLLESCHRNLLARLDSAGEEGLDETLRDALGRHLELKAHHVGAMAVLVQLIEPERRSALVF